MKNFSLKCFLIFVLSFYGLSAFAQLDKVHYIPPFFAPQAASSSVKNQWIVLSTQETTAFNVSIYRGTTLYKTISVSKDLPRLVHLGSGFSSANNPTGVVNENGINRVLSDDGFMLEGEKSFFAAIYQRSNYQGDVLTCKGATALGQEFYSGHIFGDYGNIYGRAQFLTVMATFDNTRITFSNPRVKWDGQGSNTFSVTLNKNESYALGAIYANALEANYDINDYNGTKVTSTKPIAVNTGSWMGSANTGNQQDIGIDQLVPQNFVGKKYIAVKGYGTDRGEKVIVVATKANTQLFVNDTLEHTFLQSGEYYVVNSDEYNSTTNNVSIESSENVYLFQTLSGKYSDVSVGMCFIPPLSCLSNREVNISYANLIGAPVLNIITELGATVTINGSVVTHTPQVVVGNPDWVTFRLDSTDIAEYTTSVDAFEIISTSAINAALAFQSGSIGGAGFFSGFGVSPQLLVIPTLEGTEACYPNNAVLQADGYDSYIWYFDNEIIEGQNEALLIPSKTGQYRVSGTTSCGTTKASDPFILKTCLSMEGGGEYLEDAGDVMIKLRLGLPSDDDVTYWYRTVALDGGATEGRDYEAKTGIGVMPAGSTEDSLFISILDDEADEADSEGFLFEIYFADNATVQNDILTFTIIDNDNAPTIKIMGNVNITEGEGAASVAIAKIGDTENEVTVDYYTTDLSAIAGTHYEETKGTLTFLADEYLKSVRIPLIDNDDLNDRRILSFHIVNVVNADVGVDSAKVTIYDDDVASANVAFMPTTTEEVEEGEELWLNIQLSEKVAVDVTFDISVEYYTADSNDVVFNGPIACRIDSGQIEFNLYVPTIDDRFNEDDEYLSFVMSNVENAVPGQMSSSYTILNNDFTPELLPDNFSSKEDVSFSGSVIANDITLGDAPVVITFTPPLIGEFTDLGLGTFSFMPPLDFSGAVHFTYQVKDATNDSASANVQILVEQVNDVPVAHNDTVTTDEDTPFNIYPLGNDEDIDGTGISVESVYDNKLGAAIPKNSYINYQPYRNVNGLDVLNYEIKDTEGDPSFAKIYVTVRPVNDVPLAYDDTYRLDEDASTTTLDVLQNDDDQDASGLTIKRLYNVTGGTAQLVNNKVEYTLDANFWGNATISYTMQDGEGDSASATAYIEVVGANDYPVANDDYYYIDEDNDLLLMLLSNDVDDDQRGLTLSRLNDPLYGELDQIAGQWMYSPNQDFCGLDSFRYFIEDWNNDMAFAWATINVNCINEAPRALADTFVLNEDAPMTVFDVMQNDEDPDHSGVTLIAVFDVSGGDAIISNQKIEYSLTPNYSGIAGFSYVLQDGENDLDTVAVHIVVLPLNDSPIANNDTLVVREDSVFVLDVLANDEDVDFGGLIVESFTKPQHGGVAENGGIVTYIPTDNYCGQDSFMYIIADKEGDKDLAWVYISVSCVNDVPLALADSFMIQEDDLTTEFNVLQNDKDFDNSGLLLSQIYGVIGGSAYVFNHHIYFKPQANFFGDASLHYVIVDGENDKDTAEVHIYVLAGNDYPVAYDDSYTLNEDTFIVLSLFSNDVDVDRNGLLLDSLGLPQNGVVRDSAGVVTYIPEANYYGVDSFMYVVRDAEADRAYAWARFTILGVNDSPVALLDSIWVSEDKATIFYPLINDLDPDMTGISVFSLGSPVNGNVTLNVGVCSYKSNVNYNGLDSLFYTISDAQGDKSTAKLIFTVTPVNDYPLAYDDYVLATEDLDLFINPLINDTDVEDIVPKTFVIHQEPILGSYELVSGQIKYSPYSNLWGQDTISYVAKDSYHAVSNIARIIITIDSVNESPILSDYHHNLDEDFSDTTSVLLLAFDPDFSGLNLVSADDGAHGKTSLWGDKVIYTPDSNYYGNDIVSYRVKDGEGDVTIAQINYAIFPVNDVPVSHDDVVNGDEDTELIFNPLLNDVDVEESTLTDYTIIKEPALGSYTLDGVDIHYLPNSNLWGNDTMSYVVRDSNRAVSGIAFIYITVDSVNESPLLINMTSSFDEDFVDTTDVLAFAEDPDFSGLTLVSTSNPKHGDVTVSGDDVIYSPELNYYGADTLTYFVKDGEGDTSEAILSYIIFPINDAPVSYDDVVFTNEDVALLFSPLANDSDAEEAILKDISILQKPHMGSYEVINGQVNYIPHANMWGKDTMTYIVSDSVKASSGVATIYITVDSVNESPLLSDVHINIDEDNKDTIDVLLYAESPDFSVLTLHAPHVELPVGAGAPILNYYAKNGEITLWNNQLIYAPKQDFYGRDSLIYVVEDGEGDEAEALLTIDVLSVNDAPVAVNDFYTNVIGGVKDSAQVYLAVTENDSDVDEIPMQGRVTVDSLPLYGTLSFTADKLSIIYTPDSSFIGYDSLSYRVQDTLSAASNSAWVTILTDSFNYQPRAVNDSIVLDEDASISFNPMANDWDVQGDSLWPTVDDLVPNAGPFDVMNIKHGYVELINDTTWKYYPNPNFYGLDSGYYQANDLKGGKKTAKLRFDVRSVNDIPIVTVLQPEIFYVENSGWQNLYNNLEVKDVDSDTLYKAELWISPADQNLYSLDVAALSWVRIVKDSSLNVDKLTLIGNNTSVFVLQKMLNNVKFRNTSDNDSFTRDVKLVVWDTPTSFSDTLYTRVFINPLNDAPSNTVRPTLSGIFLPDSIISVDYGQWVDPDGVITLSHQWMQKDLDGNISKVPVSLISDKDLLIEESLENSIIWCEVYATDNGFPLPAKEIMNLTDTLLPFNYRPTGLSIDNDTIMRTMISGQVIGGLSAIDIDAGQHYTYTLTSGLDSFYIVDDMLYIDTAAYVFDTDVISVGIEVSDDGPAKLSKEVTLSFVIVNDLMPFMEEGYPKIKEIYGESVEVWIKTDKPGRALYDVFTLEDFNAGPNSVLRYATEMTANSPVVLSVDSLVSQVDYMTLITLVDTSGMHYSETYELPFQTLDINGPQFLSSTPRVIRSGIDSVVFAVRLDEVAKLFYQVNENDTMYFADSLSVDTAAITSDSLQMLDQSLMYYFTLDSLQSQMRYDIAFYAVDTLRNFSSVSNFQFSTQDTIIPQFKLGYPILDEVIGSRINYQVHFTEGGTALVRLRNNYMTTTDFSTTDELGIYDDQLSISEDSLMHIKSPELSLDGVYLLDIQLVDSAGNKSEVKTLSFHYPGPFELEINSNILYQQEELSFSVLSVETQYEIYSLNGELLKSGTVSQLEDTISFDFNDEGLYLIRFSTPNDSKSYKIVKVGYPRP